MGSLCLSGLTHSVAPHLSAVANLDSLMSTATMRDAPAILRPSMTAKPTAPRPNTTAVDPFSTLAVFHTAPHPVAMPHPSNATLSSGAEGLILATLTSCTTVYSEKLEMPM